MENAYLFQGHMGTGTSDRLSKGIYSKKEETGSHKHCFPFAEMAEECIQSP